MPPIWLVSIIARTGLSAKLAKLAAWIAMATVLLIVCGMLYAALVKRDARIADTAVQLDRADITMEVANKMEAGTTAATINQQARDETFAEDQKELQHEVDTKGTAEPVGPATAGVLARLRQQQAAGRR